VTSARLPLPVHVAVDGVAAPLGKSRARDIVEGVLRAERVRSALVSVAFVSTRSIATLNRTHLNHRGPTDVISFGFDRPTNSDPVVGDIYIAPDVAKANAKARGVPVREELARLLIHGTLHVLGHEHPEDAGREKSPMWKRQELLLRKLATPRGR
jgi:probable rRNA maturation factor